MYAAWDWFNSPAAMDLLRAWLPAIVITGLLGHSISLTILSRRVDRLERKQ